MFAEVNMLEQLAVLHPPFGMLVNHRRFELELDHTYRLVHLCQQLAGLVVVRHIIRVETRPEILAGVIAVHIHGEGCQRHKIYAVALLERRHVAVPQRQPEHIGYAAVVAGGSAHPQRVVVTPLYVEVAVFAQHVHYQVRAGAAVVHIAEHMQLVDAQPLNHIAQRRDEGVCLARRDDCLYNPVEVLLLVVVRRRFVQKFFYDIGELGRKCLAHLRACVFRRHSLTHLYQLIERHAVEIAQLVLRCPYYLKLALGIINQGAQLAYFRVAQLCAESLGHLAFYVARRIAEYMLESLVFAVQIGYKVLCSFRKAHNRFQIHYFRTRRRYVGICLCQ